MTSIDLETLLTILYVWIDDWYKVFGHEMMGEKVGRKAAFKDSEMLTLLVAQEYMPYAANGSMWGISGRTMETYFRA